MDDNIYEIHPDKSFGLNDKKKESEDKQAFEERRKWLEYYREQGINFFPLVYRSKKPLVNWKKYQKEKLTPEEEKQFFSDGKDVNIAVICGSVSDGLCVLDLDKKELLDKFFPPDKEHKLPLVETGRGYHVYFKSEKRVKNLKIYDNDGVEVASLRGEGSYVVAPPSIHPSGSVYKFVRFGDIPKLMGDVRQTISERADEVGLVARQEPVDVKKILAGIGKGDRNNSLFYLATFLFRSGKSKEDALEICKEWNRRNSPPLRLQEVNQTVGHIYARDEPYHYNFVQNPREWIIDDKIQLVKGGENNNNLLKNETSNDKIDMDDLLGALRGEYHFITPKDTEVLYFYKEGVYHADGEQEVKALLEKRYGSDASSRLVGEIIFHLKSGSYIDRDEINKKTHIPLKNGLLNLEDLTFQQFNPDVFLTYKIPTKYDSNADCPKFKKMLSEIFEDDENKIKLMQEIFGYCLCPSMPAQKSFWVYGSGANGKSTIFNILIAMLGRQNVSSISLYEIEYQRFALADLNGKLANILGEPSPKKLEKSNNFKKLTGGDLISADRKNQSRIEFVNTAKMIIYANQYPAISDTSDAFWRRIIVLKFTHKFDEKMARKEAWKDIADDEDEMAGVLNWAIDGLKRLKENNWIFTTGEDNNDRREFMLNSNPEMIFIEEQCVLDAEGWTSNDELWLEYSNWCDDAGVKMMEKNVFFKFISNQPGIINEKRTIAGVRRYGKKGIRLKKDLNTLSLDFDE